MNLIKHFLFNPISLLNYFLLSGKYRYALKEFLKYNIPNAASLAKKIAKKEGEEIQVQVNKKTIFMRNEEGAIYYITQGIKKLDKVVQQIDIPPNSTVIDGGGNVGLFTFFIKEKFPDARVIILEPSTSLIPIIKKNLKEWEKDITIIPKALTESSGTVTFYVNTKAEQTNSTDINAVTPLVKDNADIISYTVPSINLNAVIEENQLSSINLLKLDIQGGEYNVLKSSIPLFKNIEKLLVEVSFLTDDNVELCGLLSKYYPKYNVLGEVKMGADILFSN